MVSTLRRICTIVALAGPAALASAATHTVPGSHATIADALAAASPGDTIELTQNVTPYLGNVYVTTDNITITAATGLDPLPLIQGLSAPHPLAGTGPQQWYWNEGDASTAATIFNTHGAAVINAAEGLTLRNLRIVADPANARSSGQQAGTLDFRFGDNGLVENCFLSAAGIGTENSERLAYTANNHTFNNVTFRDSRMAVEHQGGGHLAMNNCSLLTMHHIFWLNGGTATLTECDFDSHSVSTTNYGCIIGNQYGESMATFERCTFRKSQGTGNSNQHVQLRQHSRGASAGIDDYNSGRYSPHPIGATFEHCEFIGQDAPRIHRGITLDTGRAGWVVKTLRFTHCNFYHITGPTFNVYDFPYPGNDYKAGGVVDRFEDYNSFKLAQNNGPNAGLTSGGHSVVMHEGQPLYVAPGAEDFKLANNSPAANIDPSGTPPYSGRYGVDASNRLPDIVTVGHTGADYTSIAAAVAAATDGLCIQITDNSAPYIESIVIPANLNSLTIQGAPGLDPRPTIQPPPGSSAAIATREATSRNHTIRNLILDGVNVDTGDAAVLDLRDSGESLVQNCDVEAGPLSRWAVFTQASRMMLDMNVTQSAGDRAYQTNLSGNHLLRNVHITSEGPGLRIEGGYVNFTDSFISAKGGFTVSLGFPGTPARTSWFDAHDSIITSHADGPAIVSNNLIEVLHTEGRRGVLLDNCDLIGSLASVGPAQSPTGTGVWVMTGDGDPRPLTYMNIVDTIFYNIGHQSVLFAQQAPSVIPGLTYDVTVDGIGDYNVYKLSPHTLAAQSIPEEENYLLLDATSDLYVNPPTDYRLLPTSLAAAFNSTGTPPYAGSQGIQPTSTVSDWSVY